MTCRAPLRLRGQTSVAPMLSAEDDFELLRAGADFPVPAGCRVTRLGRAGTVRADGSVEWDEPNDDA